MRSGIGLLLVALAAAAAGCSGGGRSTVSTTPAAHGPGTGRPPVVIGSQTFTEQLLLGQLYAQALRARGFGVRLRSDLAGPAVADRALAEGQIDGYPEYIGAILTGAAHEARPPTTLGAAYGAVRAFEAPRGIAALAPTPFARADALATTGAYARAHRLRSIAGLARAGRVILGGPPDFDVRPSGLPALRRAYGIAAVRFVPLSLGAQWAALAAARVRVAVVMSTDARLRSARYVVLADPRGAFGVQNVVPVFSRAVVAAEGPAFTRALEAVSARLTTRAMRRMNAAVELDKRSPAEVAHDFLASARLA